MLFYDHCGFIHQGEVDNDASLEVLDQVALSHAEAGADLILTSFAKEAAFFTDGTLEAKSHRRSS